MSIHDELSANKTREVVTDYVEWRLNKKTDRADRLFSLVRRMGHDCEMKCRSQHQLWKQFDCPMPMELQTMQMIHYRIGKDFFMDERITWTRIVTFISFSTLLAEHLIQQQTMVSSNLIVSSIIDWTTNFINVELHHWLKLQNFWVRDIIDLFLIEFLSFNLKRLVSCSDSIDQHN